MEKNLRTTKICASCGGSVRDDHAFCAACGTPRVAAPETADTKLLGAMRAALDEYSRIIDDVDAGSMTPDEGRQRLFAAGLIVRDGEAWLLDLAAGAWCRYDGLCVTRLSGKETWHG